MYLTFTPVSSWFHLFVSGLKFQRWIVGIAHIIIKSCNSGQHNAGQSLTNFTLLSDKCIRMRRCEFRSSTDCHLMNHLPISVAHVLCTVFDLVTNKQTHAHGRAVTQKPFALAPSLSLPLKSCRPMCCSWQLFPSL